MYGGKISGGKKMIAAPIASIAMALAISTGLRRPMRSAMKPRIGAPNTQPNGIIAARLTAVACSMPKPCWSIGTPQIMSPTVVGKKRSPAQMPQSQDYGLHRPVREGANICSSVPLPAGVRSCSLGVKRKVTMAKIGTIAPE